MAFSSTLGNSPGLPLPFHVSSVPSLFQHITLVLQYSFLRTISPVLSGHESLNQRQFFTYLCPAFCTASAIVQCQKKVPEPTNKWVQSFVPAPARSGAQAMVWPRGNKRHRAKVLVCCEPSSPLSKAFPVTTESCTALTPAQPRSLLSLLVLSFPSHPLPYIS